jgi:hypothetical protein
MFDATPTIEHVLVNAVLAAFLDRRPFKHDLADMRDHYPEHFQEMLDEMLDSVHRVLLYGDYRDDAVPRDLPTAQERIAELEAKVARLEGLCGDGLEEIHKRIVMEEPPEWVRELQQLAEENKKKSGRR